MASQHAPQNAKMSTPIKRWLLRLRRRLLLAGASVQRRDAGATTELQLTTTRHSCCTLVSWLEVDDNTFNEHLESKMAASEL